MSSSLALLVFIVGIGGLFFLDRDKSLHTSKALWLPVMWLWINGSRPVSLWLGMSAQDDSPIDQLVAILLIVLGIFVVARRRDVFLLLRRSWPVALYFSFCLLSAVWSDFPAHSFTRWIRAVGELVMVLVVATDPDPKAAIRRLISRVAFILLPASVLLVKYFPMLSHRYDQWGENIATGVTTDKNMLGVVTLVLALGIFWQMLRILRDKEQANRARHFLANFVVFCFGIDVLFIARSATSGACFSLGAGFILLTGLPVFRNHPIVVHLLVITILLGGGLTALMGGSGAAAQALGRDPDLHGRTEVWRVLIPMASNPVVGVGYETFWYGPRMANLRRTFPGINEAHNGYLELYLNLGYCGVALMALVLMQGYRGAAAAFHRDPLIGGLLVSYILTSAIYSITEAGFRMLDPIWFVLLLSVVAASRIRAAETGVLNPVKDSIPQTSRRMAAIHVTSA